LLSQEQAKNPTVRSRPGSVATVATAEKRLFPISGNWVALGHEIDHHVNRDNEEAEKEQHAEANALEYIYPFFHVMKPIRKAATFLRKRGEKCDLGEG
jgi:hypothetical protein